MKTGESRLPDRIRRFGDVLYRRATGRAEEMDAARAACRIVSRLYAPGMRLLDAGCGAGHYLRSLRKRIDPRVDYVGIDASEHFIDLARRAFPGEDRFFVQDVNDLDFPDASFDIVICCNVIPNLPPPPTRAMAELLRVARRNVVLRTLFSDVNYVIRELEAPPGIEEPDLISSGGEIAEGACFFNNMYTEAYYRAVLHDLDPDLSITIERDTDWGAIDTRPAVGARGTRVEGGMQISGQLILDWRFVVLARGRE
jgi:ubiquinone/menaquinone biosynthesis C-methylase UbiE